jgi:hypothetical protein
MIPSKNIFLFISVQMSSSFSILSRSFRLFLCILRAGIFLQEFAIQNKLVMFCLITLKYVVVTYSNFLSFFLELNIFSIKVFSKNIFMKRTFISANSANLNKTSFRAPTSPNKFKNVYSLLSLNTTSRD